MTIVSPPPEEAQQHGVVQATMDSDLNRLNSPDESSARTPLDGCLMTGKTGQYDDIWQ
jgi:hypothetical protein